VLNRRAAVDQQRRTLATRTLPGKNTRDFRLSDVCIKDVHHETKFGNRCIVSDINWPLTAGISLAQNQSAITQALSGLAGAAFGLAIKH
jgi:hypothetical protein